MLTIRFKYSFGIIFRFTTSDIDCRNDPRLLGIGIESKGRDVSICKHPSIIHSFCKDNPKAIDNIKLIETAPTTAPFANYDIKVNNFSEPISIN